MTIIITDDDVKRLLPMADCIEAMKVAFRDFANGVAVNRPRMRYLAQHPDPERKYLANVHVGAVPSYGIACVRAGSQIIKPPSAKVDRRLYENPKAFNWGIVILYSIETAEPLALMHEFQLSGIRVGATTAVGVDAVARKDAATLGLFGTGKQAHAALEAIACVRPIEQVNVYSPSAAHRAAFVRDMARGGLAVVAVDDARAAVAGADIVCCATTSMNPVFDGEWLEDGQVVVSIANSDVTNKRSEVDRRTYERATAVIVNDWESVIDNDQTELLDPLKDGVIRADQIHELGDLLIGKTTVAQPPRGSADKGIVYFKNNSGLAIQFAAAGGLVYNKAIAQGNNKTIPTEWLGSDLSAYYDAGFRPSP
ncbi:ornithine cyclodeaminase family protein [Bradyrhizobium sp.]|uniref:ornithine cyclodeaminase family protein n=1 Tax=Bradyrhizobium sp. TaxID=376 RepID=UPI0025C3857E|nr:ornithine cyclodeaminase family protein [Bradyrhizobium sp.]